MATTTRITLIRSILRRLGAIDEGTLTNTTNTALTVATHPFMTNLTGASTARHVGKEFYAYSGTVPVPHPTGISAYAPSTGVLTPSVSFSTKPDTTATFFLIGKGIQFSDVTAALDRAIQGMRYETVVPLSLVVDADMDNSGTTDWTATSATISKVTNTNVLRGSQVLRVLATAANGQARSTLINVDPTWARDWYVQVRCRAAVGTGRLIAWDNTNSAIIDSSDWTNQGWGTLAFSFQLPATCESLAIIFRSVANSDDSYWDDAISYPTGATSVPLPSWVTRKGHVRRVLHAASDQDRYDVDRMHDYAWWDVVGDESNPNNQFVLRLSPATQGPIWLQCSRPHGALTADSSTTFMNAREVELRATWELLSDLINRGTGQETLAWKAEQARLQRLYPWIARPSSPEPLVRIQHSVPSAGPGALTY